MLINNNAKFLTLLYLPKKMNFNKLYTFLRELQKNNSKEWMDANRNHYYEVRDSYISWLDKMDIRLAEVDPNYTHTTGKQAINRINNNLLYHPNKWYLL